MGEPAIQHTSPPAGRLSLPRILSLSAAVRSLKPQQEEPGGKPPRAEPWYKRRTARLVALGVLLVGSAAAITLLDTAETANPSTISGAPRLKLTDDGGFVRWQASATELTIDPSFEKLGPGTREVVALAYSTWSSERAHLPALTIDLPSTPRRAERDGVNLITYAPIEIGGHQQSLGVTIAYLLEDGTITEVDTIINSKKTFELVAERDSAPGTAAEDRTGRHDHDDHEDGAYDRDGDSGDRGDDAQGPGEDGNVAGADAPRCVQAYDLQSVLTHEAGHFFGLGEDQENREATMYYKTARCETKQRDLSEDDVAAVETVYAEAPASATDDTAQAASCAMAPTSAAHPLAAAVLALLGALGVSRRSSLRRSRAQGRPLGCPSE